ncbi:MAG: hypothetical protein RLY31_2101 [Bacteroidota bacterium]
MNLLRIGVIGAGHLGKIHLKCLRELPECFHLCGFHDTDAETARGVAATMGIRAFASLGELLAAVDVVDIVTPTASHFTLAKEALLAGKHVFVEKPLAASPAEAKELVALARRTGLTAMVGHVERFNPALQAVGHLSLQPMFIEAHRLAHFQPRGTDVPVVLDLMIHDLDIILHLVRSPVLDISAAGVAVVSETPDIANARIRFANGCVANLTASRMSMKQMRKIRLFQKDAYVGLDFLEKTAQVMRMAPADGQPLPPLAFELDTPAGTKVISVDMPATTPRNAIAEELRALCVAIRLGADPPVTLADGWAALDLAWAVMAAIERDRPPG